MKSIGTLFSLVLSLSAQAPPTLTHGPFRGHVDTQSMHVFARASEAGDFTLHVVDVVAGTETTVAAAATEDHDLTLHFVVRGLAAGTVYEPWITHQRGTVLLRGSLVWTTAMADDSSAATIAFGSCANDRTFPEQPIWGRIVTRSPHALVLLGDTPYIDDGTTTGRRRRYREFFACPAIRAALASLPTWTTWDDHDYATNDAFGAVKGSETARSVFVDYHAHDSYGDGERGIYTRFRRGPIEVFVLDTRSFADVETSVLAAGERSLLGATQIGWLQQALRASTAPLKVLACGMVWNEGVRDQKADCWGNWLPERDALFRWLGKERIGGIVLVGGDVHRSRVIMHATTDLVGYDVPEFITSPLAQNVLESNAVPVEGLVFDAGEAHSCLFLSATTSAARPTLRAVFQAGDGREFHVRELAAERLAKPDAAPHYRVAIAELRQRFGPGGERLPELDYERDQEPLQMSVAHATGEGWRRAVADAAAAFGQWDAALELERCTFARVSEEPLQTEFLHDVFLGMQWLTRLQIAGTLQAIDDGDAVGATRGVTRLLALARHLRQEPAGLAWAVAAMIEVQAAELVRRAATVKVAAAAEPMRALVRQHLHSRPPLGALAPATREEVQQLFGGFLVGARLEDDAMGQIARRFEQQTRAEFWRLAEPILTTFAALPDQPSEQQRTDLRTLERELGLRAKGKLAELKKLDAHAVAAENAAQSLALMLAGMLMPNLSGQIDEWLRATAALQDVVR